MSGRLTTAELHARIAARDAERERQALIAADRREELLALSELTVAYKTKCQECGDADRAN